MCMHAALNAYPSVAGTAKALLTKRENYENCGYFFLNFFCKSFGLLRTGTLLFAP